MGRRNPLDLPSAEDHATEPARPRLWPIGWALAVAFAVVLAALVILILLGVILLGHPRLAPTKALPPGDWFNLIKLIFAVIAGGGGIVALVVAYRRQRVIEGTHELDRDRERREQTRLFTERFTAVAGQLGDSNAAVRLAGIYAMAGLADDWSAHRQTCIDVLCGYLRMPYRSAPADEEVEYQLAWRHNQEVRHTVIRVITAHLREDATTSWQGHDFDFTGVVFDDGDFSAAIFSSGKVLFTDAVFEGDVSFECARFTGAVVNFNGAQFTRGTVQFEGSHISAGVVTFDTSHLAGGRIRFQQADITGGALTFNRITALEGMLHFNDAKISDCNLDFEHVKFEGATIRFSRTQFENCEVNFDWGDFSSGSVTFPRAKLVDTNMHFLLASFRGTVIHFMGASVTRGLLDFRSPENWSEPPSFTGLHASPETVRRMPNGVLLPRTLEENGENAAANPATDPLSSPESTDT